jgi:hypothetical protein
MKYLLVITGTPPAPRNVKKKIRAGEGQIEKEGS